MPTSSNTDNEARIAAKDNIGGLLSCHPSAVLDWIKFFWHFKSTQLYHDPTILQTYLDYYCDTLS